MDSNNGGGVKVTYIETQFVTSDAVGFKDLVQRLTGRATASPAPAPHRPSPCRATAAAGRQGCGYTTPSAVPTGSPSQGGRAPPCQLEQELSDMPDFSDLFFYFGGSERRRGPHNGGYNDFPY